MYTAVFMGKPKTQDKIDKTDGHTHFFDGVKFSFQSNPFETWLDQRMTYRQPQKDWVMHLQH